MLREFYKEGKCYDFEIHPFGNRMQELLDEGYVEIFDRRRLSSINGCISSIILENDMEPPEYLSDFQKELISYNSEYYNKNSINSQVCSLNPGHIPEIERNLKEGNVKNILIDSLFKDIDQFRYVINNCLSSAIKCNFLINSHRNLLKILNDELSNNLDKYKVRNPYYKLHDGTEWFNELTFTLLKNNIYEIDKIFGKVSNCKKILFKNEGDKLSVKYDRDFKFIYGKYSTTDTDDSNDNEQSSIWKEIS